MKRLKTILIFSAIIIIIIFLAYNDYSWSNKIINKYTNDGWIVAATSNNLVIPSSPWTIIKQPVSLIAFFHPNKTILIGNGIIMSETMWVDYSNLEDTKMDSFRELYNCENNTSAIIEKEKQFQDVNLTQLTWHKFEDSTPGYEVTKKICEFANRNKIVNANTFFTQDFIYGYLSGYDQATKGFDLYEKYKPIDETIHGGLLFGYTEGWLRGCLDNKKANCSKALKITGEARHVISYDNLLNECNQNLNKTLLLGNIDKILEISKKYATSQTLSTSTP